MMAKSEHHSERVVIDEMIAAVNRVHGTPYILKGGTALMTCYGLDRFSEDIDLDAEGSCTDRDTFFETVAAFCSEKGYRWRPGKNTDTVGRAFVHHDSDCKPLKVEVSYRRSVISESAWETVNGIKVYTISELCRMKCAAYLDRDKIRDLYDTVFICTEKWEEIDQSARDALLNAFEHKDLAQFDYLVRTDEDSLVDVDALETRFLQSFEILGLSAGGWQQAPRAVGNGSACPEKMEAIARSSARMRNAGAEDSPGKGKKP